MVFSKESIKNPLYYEHKANGFQVAAQKKIKFYYKEIEVGDYFAGIMLHDLIILGLKAQDYLVEANEFQLII